MLRSESSVVRSEGTFTARGQHGKVLPWVLAAALLAGAGGGGWWWTQHQAADSAKTPDGSAGASKRFAPGSRVQPVSVAVVQQRDMAAMVQAIGNMAALNTAVVRARVEAELTKLHFTEGQMVQAGQLLAELDNRAQQVALAQAQGQLVRDQALLKNAQLDWARYKDLLAKDSIAAQQVDTQEAQVRQLQGTVQADQAAVDNAQLQLSYTRITAPISGRLGLKQADLGSTVRASDANGLVTITQTQPIALVFAVPEGMLPRLRGKMGGKEPLVVEVWDREFRNRLGQGRVTTVDNAIDATTGTIKVKAEFANADGSLFPNQFVNVRLTLAIEKNALAIPNTALQRGAQGSFVYAVQADSTVVVRRVRPGAADGDWVAIAGDLAAGDRVVTDGADRLREGAQVDVIAPQKPREPREPGQGGGASGSRPEQPGAPGKPPADAQPGAPASKPTGPVAEGAGQPSNPPPSRPRPPGPPGPPGGPESGPLPGAGPQAGPGGPPGGPGGPGAPMGPDGMPPWLDRLPPEVQERFKAMNPEERKAFIEKMRERRRQRDAQGG